MPHALQNLSNADAEEAAWQCLLAAYGLRHSDKLPAYVSFDCVKNQAIVSQAPTASTCLCLNKDGIWCCSSHIPSTFGAMFDLYLPILGNRSAGEMITAHLGQSVDSQIATASGDSFFVTGEKNRKHLHCLRALSDAVIVGASTVEADDPQLTTRAVPGSNPVRVILDPSARLRSALGVFTDAQARTILIHQSSIDISNLDMQFGPDVINGAGQTTQQVERWIVPNTQDGLTIEAIVSLLANQGLKRLFVEGGGITVSRFFEAGCLDRLHVAVAPLLIGRGTQALQIAGPDRMINAHRPPCAIYRMGEDILWDFDISAWKTDDRATDVELPGNTASTDEFSVQRIF